MARAARTLRAIYGTAALAPLGRVTAHALALCRTPGNFRLKRRGVGFEKRGNCRGFTRGCHDLPAIKKEGGWCNISAARICRGGRTARMIWMLLVHRCFLM